MTRSEFVKQFVKGRRIILMKLIRNRKMTDKEMTRALRSARRTAIKIWESAIDHMNEHNT